MKTQIQEIYKCDFCRKAYQVKNACERHEKMCKKNPTNDRPCFHCQNLEMKEVRDMEFYGEVKPILRVFFCNIKEIYLYPPQSEIRGNALSFGERNEPMPKKCNELI